MIMKTVLIIVLTITFFVGDLASCLAQDAISEKLTFDKAIHLNVLSWSDQGAKEMVVYVSSKTPAHSLLTIPGREDKLLILNSSLISLESYGNEYKAILLPEMIPDTLLSSNPYLDQMRLSGSNEVSGYPSDEYVVDNEDYHAHIWFRDLGFEIAPFFLIALPRSFDGDDVWAYSYASKGLTMKLEILNKKNPRAEMRSIVVTKVADVQYEIDLNEYQMEDLGPMMEVMKEVYKDIEKSVKKKDKSIE